jgi:hypothetical protein
MNFNSTGFEDHIIASGSGTVVALPFQPPDGFECTVTRNDASNAIVVTTPHTTDQIKNGTTSKASWSLNTDGASMTMTYLAGTWYVTATAGTVA